MNEAVESITNDDEFEDGSERTPFTPAHVDTALLTSPAVLRATAGIGLGLAVLTWPSRTDLVLARLLGITLVWLALASLRKWASAGSREWPSVVIALAALAAGAGLLVSPSRSTVFLGRVIGATLIGVAIYAVYQMARTRRLDRGRLALHGLIATVGVVTFVLTEDVIGTVISVGALSAIAVSVVVLIVSLDARTDGAATYTDTTTIILTWLRDRPKSVDARQALYDKILFEGPRTQTRVIRFFALMGFAAVIASMGVITDSTAVVIGAMLVAPLMTPLMGMAISLVMGWPNRLGRSTLIAVGGILFAIGVGVFAGLVAPAVIDTETNTQIIARTSPTILDLITAIAAGAAGAYGLSRPDVSDSLPGVAIAISLVPPLCVVGISYSQADWASGHGALLLFATNMIAILLVGGLTFVLTGVTPLVRVANTQHRVRTAVLVTCTAAVLVVGALMINGAEIATNAFQQSTVESTIDDWLADDPLHRVAGIEIEGDTVSAIVIGPSEGLPDVTGLADDLSDKLGKPITANVSLVVEERLTATGG